MRKRAYGPSTSTAAKFEKMGKGKQGLANVVD